jgi:hypothetical protein
VLCRPARTLPTLVTAAPRSRSAPHADGIRQVTVHDARHTAATLLPAQSVDQRVVMEILGHSQISLTSRYAHALPPVNNRRRLANRLGPVGRDVSPTATRSAVSPHEGSEIPGQWWGARGSNPEPTD